MSWRIALIPLVLLPAVSGESKLPAPAAGQIDFNKQVKPILAAKCLGCHGPTQQQSGLRLDKRQNALRGGDYGPVITPGKSAESKLILRLAGSEAGLQMPPTGALPPEDIGILRAWIDQGAEFPELTVGAAETARAQPLDPKLKAFLDTVRRADARAARKMLRANRSLATARDPGGATALMHAAAFGGAEVMRLLLDAGADPNARNRREASALIWGITDRDAVQLLLARGADPNVRSVEGRSPVLLAAGQPGGADILRLLLDKGADPNVRDLGGRSALMAAAAIGSTEAMRILVAKGAQVNASMVSGSTALISAAGSRNLSAVQYLIERGADVNARTKRGGSALSTAASWGSLDVVKLLLENGARVDTKDDRGYTPLMYAAYSESMPAEVVRLLLARGADSKATGEGETALSLAGKRGDTEVVRLLK